MKKFAVAAALLTAIVATPAMAAEGGEARVEVRGGYVTGSGLDDATLGVDDGKAALAHALVDVIEAEQELVAATCCNGSCIASPSARWRCGRADAVLQPSAILRKRREDCAVVALHRIEVALRDGDQAFARSALMGW